jgi:hypothetical protein
MWKIVCGVLLGLVLAGPVWAAEEYKPVHVFQDAASATGNGTALGVAGWSTIGLQVVISDTATVTFEATADDSNWVSAVCTSIASTSGALVTSATASGLFKCNVAGMTQFRARISSYTGGTVTAKGLLTVAKAFGGGGGGGSSSASSITSSDTLPATCTVGDVYVDNDAVSLSLCSATDTWTAVLTSETQTLQLAFAQGKAITGANSEANCFRVGTSSNYYCIYSDAGTGLYVKPEPLADTVIRAWTNNNIVLRDEEGATPILTIDPDAATPQLKYLWDSDHYPLKSVWIPAGAMSTDGTQCAAPAEVTINSGAKRYTIICADNDSSTAYAELAGLDDWDGGVIYVRGYFIQTAADTSNMNSDIAAACRPDSEIVNNTWGTEVAMDTAMEGSSNMDTVLTAAITPNGTCTGAGTLLQLRWQLDATGTTTAVATLHLVGFQLKYSSKSLSH